jgi:hypothetical protein
MATKAAQTRWPPWSWQGAVAFLLSATIVLGTSILVIGVAFRVQNSPIPESLAGLLTAVVSAKVGILGTFLGRFGSGGRGDSNAKSSGEQRAADKVKAEESVDAEA